MNIELDTAADSRSVPRQNETLHPFKHPVSVLAHARILDDLPVGTGWDVDVIKRDVTRLSLDFSYTIEYRTVAKVTDFKIVREGSTLTPHHLVGEKLPVPTCMRLQGQGK